VEAGEANLDLPAKKKKKKKKPEEAGATMEEDDDKFGIFDINRMPKRKKRKKMCEDESTQKAKESSRKASKQAAGGEKACAHGEDEDPEFDEFDDDAPAEEEEETKPVQEAPVWHNLDRAYTYPELLSRIFSMLNPDISSKKAFKMKPPVVVREGTKRVVLVNFQVIVMSMQRLPEHLLTFMLAELGTSGSLDGQGRVTFKYAGRQAQKHMESVIKQYVKEYVLCKLCKSSDTKLNKDSSTRLYFMVCGSCGASRSVNPIKSGFQAQIGKRKKAS